MQIKHTNRRMAVLKDVKEVLANLARPLTFFSKEVFYILHGNLRELISTLVHDRKHVELWLVISMLMTAACFFYASFMEIATNFERYLWLGATCACSVVTVFIFGLFLGLTWAKRTLEDAKEHD